GDHSGAPRSEVRLARVGSPRHGRPVVGPAGGPADRTGQPATALQFSDGTIVTGTPSGLLGCSAAMFLNALKYMAGIADGVHLLQLPCIEPIQSHNTRRLRSDYRRLHTDVALSVLWGAAADSEGALLPHDMSQLLCRRDVHAATIRAAVDESMFRQLGTLVTAEPQYWRNALYHRS